MQALVATSKSHSNNYIFVFRVFKITEHGISTYY